MLIFCFRTLAFQSHSLGTESKKRWNTQLYTFSAPLFFPHTLHQTQFSVPGILFFNCYKIDNFPRFSVYSREAFRTFTLLCNHHLHRLQDLFIFPTVSPLNPLPSLPPWPPNPPPYFLPLWLSSMRPSPPIGHHWSSDYHMKSKVEVTHPRENSTFFEMYPEEEVYLNWYIDMTLP